MDGLDRPFLISSDSHLLLSFGQLDAWAETVAWCLKRNGVGPGDVVVAELPNSPAFAAVLSATWNIGAVFAPLDPNLSAGEKREILTLARPRVVVTPTPVSSWHATLLWRNPFESPAQLEWIPARWGPTLPDPTVNEGDRLILFTAGSAGAPKAVALTETNVASGIAAVAGHFALTPEDRTIALLPWSQGHGLFANLLATLQARCTVVMPTVNQKVRSLLDSARPTWLTLLPPQLDALTAGLTASRKTAHPMRFLRTASAPLPRRAAERAEQLLGCPVVEALELAETSHQAAADPPSWQRVPGTVGTPTGVEFRLTGEEIAGGHELEVRGSSLFSRYLGNPSATAAAFTADGWLRTRDVARQAEDGRLRILGRLSEIAHRGDRTVAPVDVETVLDTHPDVVSSLVTRVPHPELVDDVAAVVRLRDGAQSTERDILKHCRAHLDDYQVPGRIRMVETLPRLASGKPSRYLAARLFDDIPTWDISFRVPERESAEVVA
ncbi:AMP-binding protein [Nocardia sp. NBC_00565]|uniref:class I adenylate-forming enzyme family protein n=1 Tax=Nocardia sp. NBC_00565 TaxID=2975993 RepID=UPI002E81ED8A|nr:AMP-binding protein [Nocardia sp. NBC_00565]WUC07716.1 AMP-binding protein [Nocardia sp. NBC_00565]